MLTLEEREFRAKLLHKLDKLTDAIETLNENLDRISRTNDKVQEKS
jgi:prefoldin subunit 5